MALDDYKNKNEIKESKSRVRGQRIEEKDLNGITSKHNCKWRFKSNRKQQPFL